MNHHLTCLMDDLSHSGRLAGDVIVKIWTYLLFARGVGHGPDFVTLVLIVVKFGITFVTLSGLLLVYHQDISFLWNSRRVLLCASRCYLPPPQVLNCYLFKYVGNKLVCSQCTRLCRCLCVCFCVYALRMGFSGHDFALYKYFNCLFIIVMFVVTCLLSIYT